MEGISDSGKVEVRSWKQILKITPELQVERCQISTSLQEKRAFIRLSRRSRRYRERICGYRIWKELKSFLL
ncbi:hypothetical protein D3Z55_15220 [Clostridiaceae bacterium]|nr:hypothetical protein [Clostridiaceae bacterium]